eukprot:TRINITY_DN21094_c0_g1_i4.p2 TRINITY_DN21094_c0_g1~~TRINITY_DN21094_c0_g1_i4.p2  ORF type:complete len:116 (+),score=11.06 TRINITY_DN21094_c0_g1_i4:137-484(+)
MGVPPNVLTFLSKWMELKGRGKLSCSVGSSVVMIVSMRKILRCGHHVVITLFSQRALNSLSWREKPRSPPGALDSEGPSSACMPVHWTPCIFPPEPLPLNKERRQAVNGKQQPGS